MKVKVLAELILEIPGELQDDKLAFSHIDQSLRDQLYVGCSYDETTEQDLLYVHELNLRSYIVLSGKIDSSI